MNASSRGSFETFTAKEGFETPSRTISYEFEENGDDLTQNTQSESDSDYSTTSDEQFIEHDDEFERYEDPALIQDPRWERIKYFSKHRWLKSYNAQTGPSNIHLDSSNSPLEFFLLLFSPQILEDIRRFTNKGASRNIDNTKRRRSKMKLWFAITKEEMKAFFGTLITMSIVRMPKISSYW